MSPKRPSCVPPEAAPLKNAESVRNRGRCPPKGWRPCDGNVVEAPDASTCSSLASVSIVLQYRASDRRFAHFVLVESLLPAFFLAEPRPRHCHRTGNRRARRVCSLGPTQFSFLPPVDQRLVGCPGARVCATDSQLCGQCGHSHGHGEGHPGVQEINTVCRLVGHSWWV